jgi:hypothetical protein
MSKFSFIICVLLTISIISCKKDPVTPPINNLSDTTSHNFFWQSDTIGIYPSNIDGVWGADVNNVYGVGLIFYSYSPYLFTGIIHWDGAKWNSMDYHEGWLHAIYGFGSNDIWAVGHWQVDYNQYALITHWDGKIWTSWKLQQYPGLYGVWGSSSTNIYAVGSNGLILHYDGSTWSQQFSGTTSSFHDIWGIDSTQIYVAAFENAIGELLKYNGNEWQIVTYGGINDNSKLYGQFFSVWCNSINKLYLVGSLSYEGIPGNWKLSDIPYNSPGPNLTGLTAMECVRGNSGNNVFICGDRDLIIHWNGKSWNIYYQFFDKSKQSSLHNIWLNDKNVFIVGFENNQSQAIVYRGKQ